MWTITRYHLTDIAESILDLVFRSCIPFLISGLSLTPVYASPFLTSSQAATKIDNNGNKTIHETKKDILMARWRFPSLSLHGIEGAFSSAGAKTVIPCSVIGKFSIRLVPSQKPKTIENLVKKHLQAEFDKVRI